MIFKITFNDNDFTQYLERMCERCKINLLWDMPKPANFESLSVKEQCDYYLKDREFRDWCNVNCLDSNKLNIDEIKLLEERVKANVLNYLKTFYPEDYWYFEKRLKVKFIKSFKVNWENGESVYYFPFNRGKWLSQ